MEKATGTTIQTAVQINALLLAQKLGKCIEALVGKPCSPAGSDSSAADTTFHDMIIIVPFSGTVQGYCVIAMKETVAAHLFALYMNTMGQEQVSGHREEYVGFCQEILNVAVGQSMVEFERDLGDLSHITSFVVYGEIAFPPVLIGRRAVTTPAGEIQCAFVLDMAKPKIARKLNKIVEDLSIKTIESITDGLTKVYNRSFFEKRLCQEIAAAQDTKRTLGLIMIDIDHFKNLNDTFGHVCGDDALRAVAEALKSSMAETDFAGRYGGDEFIAALPGRNAEACVMMAERIRSAIKESISQCAGKKKHDGFSLSVSMGVTNLTEQDSCDELLCRVDKLLYSAKRAGRNMFMCG